MIELNKINSKFKDFELSDISLNIKKGEYHVLVGPSGAGKTLLLNIIAGFVKPDSGRIILNNSDITDLLPQNRNVSYLFQDLALFPHLTVEENVAFPLKIRKMKKQEISTQVKKYLEFTDVLHLKDRSISKLSGGEKQRVALARNLITESGILMLDEPFSAIDTQLKLSLKKLLKKISDYGVTIIHVTHNPEEAISLAHKITVVENGKIISSGTYKEVFSKPLNMFMAGFSGFKNFFKVKSIFREGDSLFVDVVSENNNDNSIRFEISGKPDTDLNSVIIDSSNIILSENKLVSSARNSFEGIVESVFRVDSAFEVEMNVGIPLWVKLTENSYNELGIEEGKKMWISFKASAVSVF
jgi:molybdopterin-binding protein